MKISLNWVREFTPVKASVDDLVEKIGAQIGAVEEVIDLGKKYQGIVVAKVITCEKHQNADKLQVCMIDDAGVVKHVKRNDKGLVQVVCGAPNVKAGMLVAWLPPGVTVPSTVDKDPFVLEARDLRGVVSNGMLASAHELALSDDHSGIVEVEAVAKPGDNFADVYGLNDQIIDVENKMFTHRPDCFGQLGVAREIAGIYGHAFKSPDWYIKNQEQRTQNTEGLKLEVRNEIPALCPRYMGVIISGVKIGPSPLWLQSYLSRVGIRPINNIVDMTNYIMVLTAQPLHAFDYDKVAKDGKATIVVRKPKKGEKMTLLDGKTIEPRADAILICDPEKPIALGGVMGGNNSEIDENTTRIIIECANFDMYNIRKTSMEHGIFTDAVTRFNKGQSAWQCLYVLQKAIAVTQELCPGAAVSKIVDNNNAKAENPQVTVTAAFVNERLGTKLSLKDMAKLLENVEFKITSAPADKNRLHVRAPFWRTDIHIPEDVVEEIGRLYGYDHLPKELPKRVISPTVIDPMLQLKSKLRSILSSAGANEVLTYSFVHGDLMKKVGQDPEHAFKIANALSPDLQYYRPSLIPSLLTCVHPNIKAGYGQFALFEINQTHSKDLMDDGLPIEEYRLGLVFAADEKAAKDYDGAAYYQARAYLLNVLNQLGISEPVFELTTTHEPQMAVGKAAVAPYDRKRAAYVKTKDGTLLAEIGEFNAKVRNNLKLPVYTAGFELDVLQLLKLQNKESSYTALPRFPKVQQDISLKVPINVSYGEVYACVWGALQSAQPENTLPTLEPLDVYQKEEDKDHKQITLRLTIASYDRTMIADEVNQLLDGVAATAKEAFGAERL